MQSWRLSKYAPSRRDATGRFLDEDWTSVHDIGREVQGCKLGVEEYLRVEDAYVRTVISFHAEAGAPLLFARGVERTGPDSGVPGEGLLAPPPEDQPIRPEELPLMLRSCLREILWCRLEAEESTCLIHFGYEYYVYLVGADLAAGTRAVAQAGGLFLEPFRSPYLPAT